MNLSIFYRNKKSDTHDSFIECIIKRLKRMEEELVIDRFEEEFAVCQNRKTGEIVNIKREDLPEDVKEGSIIKYEDDKYVQDLEKEEEISKRIEEKMNSVWED